MSLQIIWDVYNNLTIRDIPQDWYGRIKEYMLENYFKPHRLFEQLKYQEDEGINEAYLSYLTHILNDECSIIVIDEETEEIHAIALVKWMSKDWKSWIALQAVCRKSRLNEIITLRQKMFFEYVNKCPDEPFDSLHLFEYYIAESNKLNPEFIYRLINAVYEVARHMKMPQVTFMAMSYEEQLHARFTGMKNHDVVIYSMYVDDNRRPLALLRDIDEMNSEFFVHLVDPIVPYKEMPGFEEVEAKILQEKLREEAEKQAAEW